MARQHIVESHVRNQHPEGRAFHEARDPAKVDHDDFTLSNIFRAPAWVGAAEAMDATYGAMWTTDVSLEPWRKQLAALSAYFAHHYPDNELPEGLALYHVSPDLDPVDKYRRLGTVQGMFFGYDATIAALYATEQSKELFSHPVFDDEPMRRVDNRQYLLHVYRLTRALKFQYKDEDGETMGDPVIGDTVVVHPQWGIRQESSERFLKAATFANGRTYLDHIGYFSDLSTEVTIPAHELETGAVALSAVFRLDVDKVRAAGTAVDVGACVDPVVYAPIATLA